MTQFKLLRGDCLDHLDFIDDNSIDSIVTDPPYGLTQNKKGGSGTASVTLENPYGRARIGAGNGAGGFMGMKWDSDVPPVEIWAECLRVLKPGGYLLAFGGTRTQHKITSRIEDAGFEIRDMIAWVYGSGFPKSHNGEWGGTALKPALEPITMARKPLIGTVEANWREHGTGALNIDGCRVGTEGGTAKGSKPDGAGHGIYGAGLHGACVIKQLDAGRWPANLIHDGSDDVVAAFPQAQGQQGTTGKRTQGNVYGEVTEHGAGVQPRGDKGSASRFFYCAKASRSDRGDDNTHPTVKPTELMRYLCRLVTPPGGVVLDPFMGSGSTGRAAMLEGFRFIGIEREQAYMEIARRRIANAAEL